MTETYSGIIWCSCLFAQQKNIRFCLSFGQSMDSETKCVRINIREFNNNTPTKNGIALSLMELRQLATFLICFRDQGKIKKSTFNNTKLNFTDGVLFIGKGKMEMKINKDIALFLLKYLPAYIHFMTIYDATDEKVKIDFTENITDIFLYVKLHGQEVFEKIQQPIKPTMIQRIKDDAEEIRKSLFEFVLQPLDLDKYGKDAENFIARINIPALKNAKKLIESSDDNGVYASIAKVFLNQIFE